MRGSSGKSVVRAKRWLVLLAAVLVVGAAAGHVALRLVLSTAFLQERFSRELAAASGGLYRVSLGGTSFDLIRNRVRATDVALFPDSAALSDSTRAVAPEGLYSISAPLVVIEGTSLWSLLHGRIRSRSLRLVRPHLHLALDSRRATPRDTFTYEIEENPGTGELAGEESFHLRLSRQLPHMSIGMLQIEDAAFSWARQVRGQWTRDSVGSIFVDLYGIDTDSASASDTTRVLFSDDVRFRVGGYTRISENAVYLMAVDSVLGSTRDGVLVVRSMQFVPILTDSQLKRRLTHRTTRYSATATDIELNGLSFRKVFEESSVIVKSTVVRNPVIDIYLDRTLPSRSAGQPVALPHQSLQAISWNLSLDTLRIENGRVVYSERASDGARPGVMRFEEFVGELHNVSNIATAGAPHTRLNISARLNGTGRLNATVDYDMTRRGLNMSYSGTVAGMAASVFNETLVDIEGIKVESGHLDSARFAMKVEGDSASGVVKLAYRDLKVAFQNKDTGARGLFDRIKSLLANAIKLRSGNPVDDGAPTTTAVVNLRRAPETPLLGFMWHTIRAGMMTTLGM